MGGRFSRNRRNQEHDNLQHEPAVINGTSEPHVGLEKTTQNEIDIKVPTPQARVRNKPLYLDVKRGDRKMILRNVPLDDGAQMLELLSRAERLCMHWKGKKKMIRRRRARQGVNFGFAAVRVAFSVIGLVGIFGGGGDVLGLLPAGGPDIDINVEDDGGLGEDNHGDAHLETDGGNGAGDHDVQGDAPAEDDDPSIPPQMKAAFMGANLLTATTGGGRAAREVLAAKWNISTLRKNIAKLRRHTEEEIVPYLPENHTANLAWVKKK